MKNLNLINILISSAIGFGTLVAGTAYAEDSSGVSPATGQTTTPTDGGISGTTTGTDSSGGSTSDTNSGTTSSDGSSSGTQSPTQGENGGY